MAQHLIGKVAAVTGAGRGIGRGIALTLAQEGASVVVADYGGRVDAIAGPSREPAGQVARAIRDAGGRAVACYANVATMAGGQEIVQAALSNFGRLDALVCCAGILAQKHLWEMDEADWDSVIAVHLKGHFSCARAAAPVMMRQRRGRLVFFSSSAFTGSPIQPSYAAAKAGILGFTWSCANALGPYGVTANCILPGGATRMTDKVWGDQGLLTDQVGQRLRSDLAAGTYRDPANVAPAVAYLVSDQASGINGQVFGAVGHQITRLAGPAYAQTIKSDGPWDLDELFRRFPKEMGSELGPPRLPWPPPVP
jgi:NAD(P)-dependent dehydrogenase (short-subunit alcohol dehydrogenase family)